MEEIARQVSVDFEKTRTPISPTKALAIFDLFLVKIKEKLTAHTDLTQQETILLPGLGKLYCKAKRRTLMDDRTGEKSRRVVKALKWITTPRLAREFKNQPIIHNLKNDD